jgi:hypothetical protein
VYISRDVVFIEHVFPFSLFHPNAGARLRAELTLLPNVLKNPFANFGDAILHDQSLINSIPTNPVPSSTAIMDDTGSNLVKNDEETTPNGCYFMCREAGDKPSPRIEVDPPEPTTELAVT